jgi:hypothetical protein
MNHPYLQAVIEVPWHDEASPLFADRQPLWEFTTELKPFSFISLSAATTNREIGLFMSQLIEYNQLACTGNIIDRLTEIIEYQSVDGEDLVKLSGGIQASDRGLTISPSCCCGLETWREWLHFLSTGQPPWMGHDPTPSIDLIDDRIVRVSIAEARSHIDFDRELFSSQLIRVRQDLVDFLGRVEVWSGALGFPEPKRLASKLDRFFSISQDWRG